MTAINSASAEAAAGMACMIAPPTPPSLCGNFNPNYVLAVTYDSVKWVDPPGGTNYGRNVNYSLELWPTTMGKFGAPVNFQSTVTEHLTNPMSFGSSSSGQNSGEFDDFLGSIGAFQSGTYTTQRCFNVTSPTKGNLGQVKSYDAAGTHFLDYIQITQSTRTTILNHWTNPDGSPKNIEAQQ